LSHSAPAPRSVILSGFPEERPVSVLLVEKSDGVATLTLNRPEARNALSRELRRALERTLRELQDDPDTRVLILTGAGKSFCAGLDLVELGRGENADASEPRLIEAFHDFEGPIIGAINGHAITGGFELALACDVLIASTDAVFGDTHARVGIAPGWGLSQKLPRLIGISRAKEISFTGNFVGAEQAERWGLVNRVVEPEELLPTCRKLAEDMLSCDPATLRTYKQVIDRGYAESFGEGMRIESRMSRDHMRSVRAEDIEARREGVRQRGRRQG
jgi:enoyl-CoA hydratase